MTIASLQKWIEIVQPHDNSYELARDCLARSKFSEEQVISAHLLEHQFQFLFFKSNSPFQSFDSVEFIVCAGYTGRRWQWLDNRQSCGSR